MQNCASVSIECRFNLNNWLPSDMDILCETEGNSLICTVVLLSKCLSTAWSFLQVMNRDVWKMDPPSLPQCPMMQSPRLFLNQAILVCLLNENGLESSLSCVNKPEEAKQSMTEKAFN